MKKIKIGEFVKEHLNVIVGFVSREPIYFDFLTDKEQSKHIFNLRYSFFELKSVASSGDLKARYWQKPQFTILGDDYLVCNDWYVDRNAEIFFGFLKNHDLLMNVYKNQEIMFYDKNIDNVKLIVNS